MALLMKIINLTPDSFRPESRAKAEDLPGLLHGADIYDLGAVSTRPGAERVSAEVEWERLRPALEALKTLRNSNDCVCCGMSGSNDSSNSNSNSNSNEHRHPWPAISIDTARASIVRKAYALIGPFIVNDVSGAEDPEMLTVVRELGLRYVAMHHRGTPKTMDSMCDYPGGVVQEVVEFFRGFERKVAGIDWILDPGFGFAKTDEQNLELLENLATFKQFGRPILVGISHKRFTRGRSEQLEALAVENSADIIRKHL